MAAYLGFADIAEILLQHGANIDQKDVSKEEKREWTTNEI
jgi:hypothetical protein